MITRRAGRPRSERGPEHELLDALHACELAEAGRLVDVLRMGGWRYREIYSWVHERNGIELPEWDALLGEMDDAQAE